MKILNRDWIIDLQKTILWQYDKSSKLISLINQKQAWYKRNVTDFITNFFINVFNLKTANDFGLSVWGKILNFPRQIFLNKYQITAEQTVGSDLTDIEVSRLTFNTKIESGDDFAAVTIQEEELKTFVFTYDGSNWDITGSVSASDVDIADYGITFTGTPTTGDTITVMCDWTALNLTTEQYRFLLLGQILKFKMNCTIPEINRYLRIIFNQKNNENVYVTDNHNMTITYTIQPPVLYSDIQKLIDNYDFLPAPAGVKALLATENYIYLTFVRSSIEYKYIVNVDGYIYTFDDNELEHIINVQLGASISWSTDGGTDYITQSGSFEAIQDTTINTVYCKLQINATPQESNIAVSVTGTNYSQNFTQSGSFIKYIPQGYSYSYTVSLQGYISYSKQSTVITADTADTIILERVNALDIEFDEKANGIGTTNDIQGSLDIGLGMAQDSNGFYSVNGGQYRLQVAGNQGVLYNTQDDTISERDGKGGTAEFIINLSPSDRLKFKFIYGCKIEFNPEFLQNIICVGGMGIAVILNNSTILVVGGGGFCFTGTRTSNAGGGGYVGGLGYITDNNNFSGYSEDGTKGNSQAMDGAAGERATNVNSRYYAYGGSSFISSDYSSQATMVYAGNNEGAGYVRLNKIVE